MTPIRRRDPIRPRSGVTVTWEEIWALAKQVLGTHRLPPCARCGTPVPAGRRRCDPPCLPIVVAPKEQL